MGFALTGKRVWVAGHRGMLGSALVRRLAREDCTVLTASRAALDLTDQRAVREWVRRERPQVVIAAAARVGGILANSSFPVDFLRDNLLIETAILSAADAAGVDKLLFLGSSCIYPRAAPQPIHEDALLTGPLEPSNAWYAIAKIAGIKLAEAYRQQFGRDFICAMPTNLYGPGDNFDPASGHVVPALIRKVHEAKQRGRPVSIWGTGTPRREFLYVDDCADACVFLLRHYSAAPPVNIGAGTEISICELTRLVMEVVGYADAAIVTDPAMPDGAPRKLLDNTGLRALGWTPQVGLRDGLALTYAAFLAGNGRGI